MTNVKVSVAVGVILGILYGVTLLASFDSLNVVSFMVYGDRYYLPLLSTTVVTVFALGGTLTYKYWLQYAEDGFDGLAEFVYREKEE